MAYNTAAEIAERLASLDLKIEAAEEAVQFSLNTGQGSQSVQRASLDQLYRAREYWERKLRALESGGLVSVEYRRR